MNRWIAVVVLLVAVTAAAQPSEPIAAFLERRVPDELAAEGTVLSRRGFTLKVEQIGDKLLVSIVDATTGRVAASPKVDVIPPDREAAVATVTHVAADLVAQTTAAPPPPVQAPGLIDDREERKHHEIAELRFRREMIRFGNEYELTVNKTGNIATAELHRFWVTYRGELGAELSPEEFYTEVGHPELADEYTHRGHVMIGGFVVGGVGLLGASITLGLMTRVRSDAVSCNPSLPLAQFQACIDAADQKASDERSQYIFPAVAFGGAFLVGCIVGVWYRYHHHPIDEAEAKSLAQDYNDNLRRKLGLPTARREPRVRDLQLAPVITGSGTGLVLAGRF